MCSLSPNNETPPNFSLELSGFPRLRVSVRVQSTPHQLPHQLFEQRQLNIRNGCLGPEEMKRQKENSKVSQREQGQDTDLITEVGETKGRGEMIKT